MVFFTCNVCGEALKKNQVEKHCMTKCRRCEMVSCIDCGKDFWGNDYEQHTKCISEDQKYSGKGYVPKVNKGEAKQDRWIEQVQIAIDKNKNNPQLRGPLESIKNYPNIPRKRNKFENFLQNSLRIRDRSLMGKLWDAVMEEAAKQMKLQSEEANNVQQNSEKQNNDKQNGDKEQNSKENGEHENGIEEKKLSKRERKEERRKKMNKKEKKDREENGDVNEKEISGKKRNLEEHKEGKKGKKRKREEVIESEIEEENEEIEEGEEEGDEPMKKKTKFNWNSTIMEVLQSKGEITVKKLKKKVLAEYLAQMGDARSEEKLWAKFEKKLSKNPIFRVHKERVKLVERNG